MRVIFSLLFLVSAGMLLHTNLHYREGTMVYTEAEERQVFLDHCIEWSVLETGTVLTIEEEIWNLSTCTGRG